MKFRIGIFTRIWLAMLAVVFVPLTLIWTLEYIQLRDSAHQLVQARQKSAIDNLVTFVDGWVDMNLRLLNYNAALDAIRSMEPASQKPLLEAIVEHYPWNYLAFTVDAYGRNVARSDQTPPKDYRERGYVRQIRQGKPYASQVLIGLTSEELALVLAVPVVPLSSPATGVNTPGVLAIAMSAESVIKRVNEARVGDSGHLMLLDEQGQLIASPNADLGAMTDLANHPAFLRYRDEGAGTYGYQDSGRAEKLATVGGTDMGWILIAEQDEQEAMLPAREQSERSMLLLMLSVPVTALVAYLVSLRLARPIQRLTESVRLHGSNGDRSLQAVKARTDEIGILAHEIELSYEAQGLIRQLLNLSLKNTDLDSVLEESLALILKARWFSDHPQGGIWLKEPERGLCLRVQHQLPVSVLAEQRKLSLDSQIGASALSGSIRVEAACGTKSAEGAKEVRYIVPILGHQGTIGLVMLYQRVGGLGRETELNFLHAVSQTLGGVIERKSGEAELTRNQVILEGIIDNSSALVSLKDEEGRYLLVNRRFEELLHLSRDQVIGLTDFECQSHVISRAWARTDQQVLASGQALEYQEEFAVGEATCNFLTVKFPLRDSAGNLYALCRISTDISRIIAIEQELRSLNVELEERVQARTAELQASLQELRRTQEQLILSEKMAALGNLVGGVAHEINTPLGVCLTAASLLEEANQQVGDAYQQESLGRQALEGFLHQSKEASAILVTNLKRASELVASFKQIAVDQDSEAPRSFDLRGYLDECLVSLEPQLKARGVSLDFEGPESLEIISVPGAFSQILTQLILNALTHAFADTEQPRIKISLRRDAGKVFLRVQDNGCGMTPAQVEHLFDPFFTTKRGQGGTGLGMHLVFNLVNQVLGGEIHCDSAPGDGVRYRITLPQAENVAQLSLG